MNAYLVKVDRAERGIIVAETLAAALKEWTLRVRRVGQDPQSLSWRPNSIELVGEIENWPEPLNGRREI